MNRDRITDLAWMIGGMIAAFVGSYYLAYGMFL